MRLIAFLFLMIVGTAYASPGYHLQMELGLGNSKPEPFAMIVAEGKTASMNVTRESGGFSIEVTVTPAETNPKTGLDQVNVQVRILDLAKGNTVLRGEPLLRVPLGKAGTIDVRPDDDAAADQGYFFSVTVSRTQGDVFAGKFAQCSSPSEAPSTGRWNQAGVAG